jgi:Glyoxalase-like domain
MAPRGSDSDSENEEDERMKALLASWDDDNGDDSSDSDDEEEEEEEEEKPAGATKFDLGLEDNVLDHIVIASPDFQEALKEFENMTGIKPSVVGSLRGLGTKSARVGLDNNAYIEIIAPDPKNSGPIGAALARELEEGTLVPYHYAIRSSEVADMKDDYVPNELGWQPDHISMFGASPDGTPKKWEMLYLYGHRIGGCVPFYIDWGQCDHPSASIPEVGALKNVTVRAPAGHKVHDLLSSVKGIDVEEGDPMLEFSFGSPEGTITFSADNPVGVKFPGFEEGESGGGGADDKADYKFPGMPDLLPTSDGNGGGGGNSGGAAADSDDDASAAASEPEEEDDDDDEDVDVSDVEDSDED